MVSRVANSETRRAAISPGGYFERSFWAATKPNPIRAARNKSFFMVDKVAAPAWR